MMFTQERYLAMKVFRYVDLRQMKPRDGQTYSTSYYKQTYQQRLELAEWLRSKIFEIITEINSHPALMTAIKWPLKGFPKTARQPNRSVLELIDDMLGEIDGVKKNGQPKDFAQAPIDRWNKLWEDFPEYQFRMEFGTTANQTETQFKELFQL